jgi:hypothetical protein
VDGEDALLCAGYGCEVFVTQRMVIAKRWKYMWNGFDIGEMYDLENDPDEIWNLIDEPAHLEVRSMLRGKLYELMNRFGDPSGDVGTDRPGADRPNRYGAQRYLPQS